MPIKYIGRTSNHVGKTLWEIVGNLKNFGEERVVVRNVFERYPEKSWFRILKVEPLANPAEPSLNNMRKVKAVVEKVWRGYKYPKPIVICSVSYKADYRLLTRSEEKEYCKLSDPASVHKPLPIDTIPFPPLLKTMLQDARSDQLQLKLNIRQRRDNRAQPLNGHTEITGIPINQDIGQPLYTKFYDNVLQ